MARSRTPVGLRTVPGLLRKQFAVYVLASRPGGVLYVGVTSALAKRIWEHREGIIDGFTNRYQVRQLVYYEMHDSAEMAITREKQIKSWRRDWKIALIESLNPDWNDLWSEIAVP